MSDYAANPAMNVPDSTPPLSQAARIGDTFVAPSKTFADIRRNASWWAPWLLIAVLAITGGFALQKKVGFERMAELSMKDNTRFQQLTPEQQQQQLSMVGKTMPIFVYAAPPVFTLVIALIGGGILMALVNFGLGGRASYGQMVAVWMYSSLPNVVTSIMFLITLFVGDPDNFNLRNPVGTNPAFYMPADAPHWLSTLLQQFDVITIWAIVLMIMGASIVAGVKRSSAAAGIVGLWVLWILARVGIAAI